MSEVQHTRVTLVPAKPRTFEVMLHTLPGTRHGLEGRWFGLGPFATRLEGQEAYNMLCAEFDEAAPVVVVLVATTYYEEADMFRDRILEARGRAPLIRRDPMTPLSRTMLKRLVTATAPVSPGRTNSTPAAPRPAAPRRRRLWPVLAACTGGAGVISLLLWGAAFLSQG
jgi:hypothetical protein